MMAPPRLARLSAGLVAYINDKNVRQFWPDKRNKKTFNSLAAIQKVKVLPRASLMIGCKSSK